MFLSLLSGSHNGRVLKIEREGVIGRDPAVEYSIDDPTVSRRHAELVRSADGWRLRDLGSANGTEINGARLIGDKTLREGDVIGVGRVTMVYSTQLAGTVRGKGPASIDQTLPPDELLRPGPELVSAMLAGLRAEHRDAESQAAAALAAMIKVIPGAVRASVVDWRACKLLARAPEGGRGFPQHAVPGALGNEDRAEGRLGVDRRAMPRPRPVVGAA